MRGAQLSSEDFMLKAIQNTVLDMARFLDSVCRVHDICYSLAFGSYIGAVRHKGFIPWDDDIDIIMPRSDYERFAEVVQDELPEYYEFQNFRKSGATRYLNRLIDKRTLIKLDSYESTNDLNIWLDIFPLDGIPDGRIARVMHYAHIQWCKAACSFATFSDTVNLHRPGRPWWQQTIISLCRVTRFGSWLDARRCLEKYDCVLKSIPYGTTQDCVCGVGTYDPRRQTWPTVVFETLVDWPFEETIFRAPQNYASVLGTTYGDYMTLPPKENRTIHHIDLVAHPWMDKHFEDKSVGERNG